MISSAMAGMRARPSTMAHSRRGHEVGVEDRLQEWHGAHQQQQGDGQPNRVLHVLVGEDADGEDRGALGADGVGAEQLAQRQGHEGHRLGGLHVHIDARQSYRSRKASGFMPAGTVMPTCFQVPEQAEAEGGQHGAGLGDGLDDDAEAHGAVDDRLVLGARLAGP